MSARDKLLESPLLFFGVVAVGTYLLWPQIKEFVGIQDPPGGNHSRVTPMVFDPFGIMKGAAASQEPVPGADRQRQYRQYDAPGDLKWNGQQRFFGVNGARHGCARDANPADPDDLGCGWRRGGGPDVPDTPYPHHERYRGRRVPYGEQGER